LPSAPQCPASLNDHESKTNFIEDVVGKNKKIKEGLEKMGNTNGLEKKLAQEKRFIRNFFINSFSCLSLANIFHLLLVMGATTVFLQDVYYNYQDKQRVGLH
jgi:hypothetical protein